MSVFNGLGSFSDQLNSVVVTGVIQASGNRNLIVQLPEKNEKRIFDLEIGYSLAEGQGYTKIKRARVLIVGQSYSGTTDYINPTTSQLPQSLSSATKYFDKFVSPIDNDDLVIDESYHWLQGLVIPSGTPASVILTFCLTDTNDSQSAQALVNACVTINGLIGDSESPYKQPLK